MSLSRRTWPTVRNGILFFGGLFGVAYETFFRRPPDYGLLPVFAAMLGLPAFINDDRDDDDWDDDEDEQADRKPVRRGRRNERR